MEDSCDNDGEEAIYCEGHCGWIHRQCAGLSDLFFKLFMENVKLPLEDQQLKRQRMHSQK